MQFTNIGLCTHFKIAVAYSEWIGSLDIQNRTVGTRRQGGDQFPRFWAPHLTLSQLGGSDYTQHIMHLFPPPGFSELPMALQIVRIFLGKKRAWWPSKDCKYLNRKKMYKCTLKPTHCTNYCLFIIYLCFHNPILKRV